MSQTALINKALLALGKAQVDALLAFQEGVLLIDDSEFIPRLEAVLTAFESHGLEPAGAEELWDYAYRAYDRACRDADPNFTFEENRDLMRSYLHGPRRLEEPKRKRRG